LKQWRREHTADGVVLTGPDGKVRIRPRLSGRTLAAIASELAPTLGRLSLNKLVTDDGELGAIALFRLANQDVAIACVGGDPQCVIEGVGTDIGAVVKLLAQRCGTGLGTGRARMFEYQTPPAWRGLRRSGRTLWLHPRYPNNPTTITIYDARPMTADGSEKLRRQLLLRVDAASVEETGEPRSIETDCGLAGRLRSAHGRDWRGRDRIFEVGAVSDNRFLYQAVIETTSGDDVSLKAFDELLRSFQPLPVPRSGDSFSHWAS